MEIRMELLFSLSIIKKVYEYVHGKGEKPDIPDI
jgi:hypothetical protein